MIKKNLVALGVVDMRQLLLKPKPKPFKKQFLFCIIPMKISFSIYFCTRDGFFRILTKTSFTVLQMFRQVLFGAANQGNHQNFETSLLSYKCGLIFIGMKQTKNFFEKKKNQNGRLKKNCDFQLPQFLIFFHENFMDRSLG
jgi:hypothetical protein